VCEQEFTAGLHRLLISFFCRYGSGTLRTDSQPMVFTVEDLGSTELVPNTLILNDGGVGTDPAPPPVTSYTKSYGATWYQTYKGSGGQKSDTTANQGQLDSGSDGNQRSLVGFDYATIKSDLSGATITKITLSATAEHWWYNSGGTAVIGTHNYSSKPSSWSDGTVSQDRQRQSGWARGARKTVTLSNTIGNELKAGSSKGIAFGPGPSSDVIYYGKFTGSGSARPVLTITYTK
jgi:hypothetical protein